MPSIFPYFVAIVALFTITEQSNTSLKEIEQILKNLAAQTTTKNRGKIVQYIPPDPKFQLQQKNRNRYENNRNSEDAQSQELFYQQDNMRIQKQLEDDLQQALRYESDRICKATGRCGCFGSRCGRPHRAVDRTVDDIEELLNQLNEDLNKRRDRQLYSYEDTQQVYRDERDRYGEKRQHRNQRQELDDERQEYDDRRQEYGESQQYADRRQQRANRQQAYSYERQDYDERRQRQGDRNQRQYDRRQEDDDRRQKYNRQWIYGHKNIEYGDRRQKQDNAKLNYFRNQRYGDERQHANRQHAYSYEREDYDERRQDPYDRRQENGERKQRYDSNRQQRQVERQEHDDDEDIVQNLKIGSRNNKDRDLDIVVVEVPELNELRNRANDVNVVDIRELDIKDLLEKEQTSDDRNENHEQRLGNVNLEDFIFYYEKIKKELSNRLLKYVKGSGDGSYLSQLLPYQKKQIQTLKNEQPKTPLTDENLRGKIIQLLFGPLSNIKLLPHSKDPQTIYIPQSVYNAIPSYIRKNALRSHKRLLPLTQRQKQRQRHLAPRNIISKHAWRRSNQQEIPSYGVPFDLQVQGLGQIN